MSDWPPFTDEEIWEMHHVKGMSVERIHRIVMEQAGHICSERWVRYALDRVAR